MNEQQREAIEKAAKVFPRGLVSLTISPNGSLQACLSHPAVPSSGEVDLDREKEPDAYDLNSLIEHIIEYWEYDEEWDE